MAAESGPRTKAYAGAASGAAPECPGQKAGQQNQQSQTATAAATAVRRRRWWRNARFAAIDAGRGWRRTRHGREERLERAAAAARVAGHALFIFIAQPGAVAPVHGGRGIAVERHLREVLLAEEKHRGRRVRDVDRVRQREVDGEGI